MKNISILTNISFRLVYFSFKKSSFCWKSWWNLKCWWFLALLFFIWRKNKRFARRKMKKYFQLQNLNDFYSNQKLTIFHLLNFFSDCIEFFYIFIQKILFILWNNAQFDRIIFSIIKLRTVKYCKVFKYWKLWMINQNHE